MRFVRKGGIWKNTEDEILKAAVMKYGKNQWSRISSLLVRKSAKQCKARWYEWLDPSVKKTEWTRIEEEKLLHLAKIMPSQWRSIAAIVGRTTTQCLDHYSRLLDQAQAQEHQQLLIEGGVDESSAAASSTLDQRLRTGDIDSHPESKPARPDPVDMDEDEKEMLSEARARLANTKGKKAKRKAREKQLEEARRLASLQKRRELKAAGIEFRGHERPSKNKNKRKEMNYSIEIPLEHKVPAGYFSTDVEDQIAKKQKSDESFIGKTLTELGGQRRDDIEANERKKDAKRQALLRKQDLPAYVAQISKLNDPQLSRARPVLQLPTPQITDRELHDLAAPSASGSSLLHSYRPSTPATPMRTPMAGADSLMLEAHNLMALERSQTPLIGGANPLLHPSDWSSATPKGRTMPQTPNTLAVAQTPSFGSGATPIRDEFRINSSSQYDFDAATPRQTASQAVDREIREQLRQSLRLLPKPTNEFAMVAGDINGDDEEIAKKTDVIPDAEDVAMWENQAKKAEESRRFRLRSTVLQKPSLPRPASCNAELPVSMLGEKSDYALIEGMIHSEMMRRLVSDSLRFPIGNPKASPAASTDPDSDVTEEMLDAARALVDSEIPTEMPSLEWEAYVPGGVKAYDLIRSRVAQQTEANNRSEKALSAKMSEYYRRERALRIQITQVHREWQQAGIDLECFRALHDLEKDAIPARIARAKEELNVIEGIERGLQQQYLESRVIA